MKRLLCLAAALAPAAFCLAQPAVKIALVADTHTTPDTVQDESLYKGRLEAVIAQVNAAKVDVVLVAGDLTQHGRADEIAEFKNQVKGFQAPIFWVPGNHDVGNKRGTKLTPGKTSGVTTARVEAYEKQFGPSFFSRDVAGLRVIGLNSSLFGSGLPREAEMWSFLEKEMARPNPPPAVVFMHYPPYVHAPDEKGGGYWDIEPAPRKRLLDLLTAGGVKAILTGHLHYALENRYEGVPIVSSPPVSFGLPRGVAPEGWTLVTLAPDGEVTVAFERI